MKRYIGTFFHVNDPLVAGDPYGERHWQGRAARGRWTVFVEYTASDPAPWVAVAVHDDALAREDELRARLRRVDDIDVTHNILAVFDADAKAALELRAATAWLALAPNSDAAQLADTPLLHYCGAGLLTTNGPRHCGVVEENGVAILVLVRLDELAPVPGLDDAPVDN